MSMLHPAGAVAWRATAAAHQLDAFDAAVRGLFERQDQCLRQVIARCRGFVRLLIRRCARRCMPLLPFGMAYGVENQLVGGLDPLEFGFRTCCLIAIRMPAHGQPAIGPLDVFK